MRKLSKTERPPPPRVIDPLHGTIVTLRPGEDGMIVAEASQARLSLVTARGRNYEEALANLREVVEVSR